MQKKGKKMTQKQPLTDSQIRKLKPQKTPYRDSQSLFLKVTETSKIWLFSYIHPITQKRITKKHIGYYPAISLQEARRLRDEYRNSVQKGFCPFELAEKEARERREKAITVEKIAIKWLEWKSEKKKLKEQTRKATKSRLERYLFPKPLKFGNTARWMYADVMQWINAQMLKHNSQPIETHKGE